MDTPRRTRRMSRAQELLGPAAGRASGRWVRWSEVVGGTLAAHSAFVGRTEQGALRVAVENEATRLEIVARAPMICAAFNAGPGLRGWGEVDRVDVWIARSFRAAPEPPKVRAVRRQPAPAALTPAAKAQAAVDVDALAGAAPEALREALVRLRARMIAERGGHD